MVKRVRPARVGAVLHGERLPQRGPERWARARVRRHLARERVDGVRLRVPRRCSANARSSTRRSAATRGSSGAPSAAASASTCSRRLPRPVGRTAMAPIVKRNLAHSSGLTRGSCRSSRVVLLREPSCACATTLGNRRPCRLRPSSECSHPTIAERGLFRQNRRSRQWRQRLEKRRHRALRLRAMRGPDRRDHHVRGYDMPGRHDQRRDHRRNPRDLPGPPPVALTAARFVYGDGADVDAIAQGCLDALPHRAAYYRHDPHRVHESPQEPHRRRCRAPPAATHIERHNDGNESYRPAMVALYAPTLLDALRG